MASVCVPPPCSIERTFGRWPTKLVAVLMGEKACLSHQLTMDINGSGLIMVLLSVRELRHVSCADELITDTINRVPASQK